MKHQRKRRVLIATSNARRHRAFIEQLAPLCQECLVVVEAQPIETGLAKVQSIGTGPAVAQHFRNIIKAERNLFGVNRSVVLNGRILPLVLGDLNLQESFDEVDAFAPEMAFVFGSSWIRGALGAALNRIPSYNVHMGISPHYRGHSTNFWAFWNREPEYVGGTILQLDQELDAGAVICHLRPKLQLNDDYYSFSMRAVADAIAACSDILVRANAGEQPRHHQAPPAEVERYFKSSDFNDEIAEAFLGQHRQMMADFVASGQISRPASWQIDMAFS